MAKRLSKKEFAKQKQAEMKETINQAMGDVAWHMQNPEGVKEYLDFMSRMHDYSPRNQMLLQNQYKGAHGVAGKKHFEEMGFNIRDGEKPLKVLAPVFKKFTVDQDNNYIPLNRPTKEQKEKIESGEYKVRQKLHYYKFAEVYDLGQTDAKVEDYPKMFPNRPFQFDESSVKEKYPNLKEAIKSFAENQGFHLKDEQTTERLGNAKGAYYPTTDDIRMRPHLSDGEYISTLNHEIAHGLLHKETTLDSPTKELEAEMTAYVTNKHFGLDTSEKSIDYMANWTNNLNKLDDKETFKVIERVSKASRSLIDGIEKEYEQVKEKENTKSIEGIEQEAQSIIDNGQKYTLRDVLSKSEVDKMDSKELSQVGKITKSKIENNYLLYEKETETIKSLKIGDMRFDYQNFKSEDLKDFTILSDTDTLSVEFKNRESKDIYTNSRQKHQINQAYEKHTGDKESTIEDYINFSLNRDEQAPVKEKTKKDELEI